MPGKIKKVSSFSRPGKSPSEPPNSELTPSRAEPRQGAGASQARAAPFTSRVEHLQTRRCSQPLPQFMVTLRNRFPGRREPPRQPPPALATSSQARKPCAAARAPPEPVHTLQPFSKAVHSPTHAAHSRADPEEPRRSEGAPQARAAPLKSRPEHVGSVRAGAKCLEALR